MKKLFLVQLYLEDFELLQREKSSLVLKCCEKKSNPSDVTKGTDTLALPL